MRREQGKEAWKKKERETYEAQSRLRIEGRDLSGLWNLRRLSHLSNGRVNRPKNWPISQHIQSSTPPSSSSASIATARHLHPCYKDAQETVSRMSWEAHLLFPHYGPCKTPQPHAAETTGSSACSRSSCGLRNVQKTTLLC
jgi:hypothetical protein